MPEEGKLHPVFRVIAVLIGSFFAIVSLIGTIWMVIERHLNWFLVMLFIGGFAIGGFFLLAGVTGTNYVLEAEAEDE